MIPKTVLTFLNKNRIKHEVVEHRTVFTALDKAATLHVDPGRVVKTVVFLAGKKHPFLVSVPASKHIDKARVKTAVNVWLRKRSQKPEKVVDFATEPWMKKNLPGDIGPTPPYPEVLRIPMLADNSLFKLPKLYLNGGDYEHSLLVNQAAFKKILGENFVKGPFAKGE